MMVALEAGAEDFITEEDAYEVITSVEDFNTVREGLSAEGYKFIEAKLAYVPQTLAQLETEEDIKIYG